MDELIQKIGAALQDVVFKVRLRHANLTAEITIEKFKIKIERHTGDVLLYIKPSFEPQTIKDRIAIEHAVEHYINEKTSTRDAYAVDQVIIPMYDFWGTITEGEEPTSEYSQELYDFILKKLYKKVFKIRQFEHVITFVVHPYEVKGNTLFVDVRRFSDERNMDYKDFIKVIKMEVLDYVFHLGIRKVEVLTEPAKAKTLNESMEEKFNLVMHKEYNNYVVPIGVLNFSITDTENFFGTLRYKVVNFHLHDGNDRFVVDEKSQPFVERIVRDDMRRYGFKESIYTGQADTEVK
jgi:hypothetical protein